MSSEEASTLIILGGGQAAGSAVRRLREAAFAGQVVVISDERALPYERPGLSKEFLLGQWAAPRPIVEEARPRERFLIGRRAVGLDLAAHVVRLDEGEDIRYDSLLLATGARPRALEVPGATLAGIGFLRTAEEARELAQRLHECVAQRRRLLVVGGSWIGLEVSAAARQRGIEVVLVERGTRLCERTVPAGTAERLRALHAAHGVHIRFDTSVTEFDGREHVTHAQLSDGTELAIGAAVIGIGVVPNVELAQCSGLQTRGGIVTDRTGRTSDAQVYAAGDVAEGDCMWRGAHARYETWSNANAQGARAADSMLRDLSRPHSPSAAQLPAPWFWSDQFGRTLQVVGNPLLGATAALVRDDEAGFVETFSDGERLVGAVAIGHPRDFRALRSRLTAAPRFPSDRSSP